MTLLTKAILLPALFAALACAQGTDSGVGIDRPTVQVGHPACDPGTVIATEPPIVCDPAAAPMPLHTNTALLPEGFGGTPVHPVYYEARHPDPGCSVRDGITPPRAVLAHESTLDRVAIFFKLKHRAPESQRFRNWETATCGKLFAGGWTHNIRTSAGTTWQYNQMAGSTAAVGTYIALTNSAITPTYADTTLASEIVANGLSRALSTPTNGSSTLTVPAAPTPTVVGTTGAVSYFYWAASCSNGPICTTPSATSGTVSTANATLSTTNYVSVAFTGQLGAMSYQLYRTTSNTIPSGTVTDLVGGSPACSTTGTVVSCTWNDVSNTLTSVTIPGSNLTNFGKYTLVYTWTCTTSSQSAQAFGVLNAASSGTLIFEGTFTPVSLNVNDTLQLTETVYF